jgi:hypothetical protein
MDPLTILALAQTAYGAIKSGIAAGKEIQGMMQDVSSLMGTVGEITRLAAEPKKGGLFTSKESAEKRAMDAYHAKQQINKMMQEAQNLFVAEYGYAEWMRLQEEITRIKKADRLAREKAERERQEFLRGLLVWSSVAIILLCIISAAFFVAYLYTLKG